MRTKRTLLAAALVLVPAVARAMPTFPSAIATHLGSQHVPDCTVCHQGTPTKGTATTPLAVAMQSRGLTSSNPSSIYSSLDALAADHVDSDGDGIQDVDELKNGWDPNFPSYPDGGPIPGGVMPSTLTPSYGCTVARIGRGSHRDPDWSSRFTAPSASEYRGERSRSEPRGAGTPPKTQTPRRNPSLLDSEWGAFALLGAAALLGARRHRARR
jgi:hypothetical protein